MTEKDLKDIKFLKMEIERSEKILKDLQHWKGSEEYARILRENRADLINKRIEAESLINGIENPEIRLIVKLKFVDLRSWNYIANKLHYDRTTVYKKYKKFVKGAVNE